VEPEQSPMGAQARAAGGTVQVPHGLPDVAVAEEVMGRPAWAMARTFRWFHFCQRTSTVKGGC
jgi:hypothetical protein